MPIWLIGMLGVGKSAVAPRLAATRGIAAHDTDEWVEERSGLSIARIFATQGEVGFRRLESLAVAELATTSGVVATGGGAVVDLGNVKVMKDSGTVIWLRASPETLAVRLGGEVRPVLEGPDRIGALRTLLETRERAYSTAADIRIETDQLSPSEVVEAIQASLQL